MKQIVEKIDAAAAGKKFFLLLGIILFCGLLLRMSYPSADPPLGITRSQDFSTDPFQYVYFAKNAVDHDNSNPYGDPRFAQWEKSTENAVARIVFAVAGTGRAEGNAVAVLFNLSAILVLALALRNFGSPLAGLVFAALACFDFTMVWFGRTPFLEGAQNFWLCLSVFLFSKGREKSLFYILAGIACAAAAFFGKMIALFMAGVFFVVWLMLYLNNPETRKAILGNAIRFGGGFGLTTLVYLVLVYLPSRSQVSSYLSEQAFGLYGAPQALESVENFCFQLMTLLSDTEFFIKMPIITVLAFIGGAGILTWLAVRSKEGRLFGNFNAGWVLILIWFGAAYVALFPWNYRPLRYQTTLMFPAFALAAITVAYVCEYFLRGRPQGKKPAERSLNLPVLLISWSLWLLPIVALIVIVLLRAVSTGNEKPFVAESTLLATILFLGIGALIGLLYKTMAATLRNWSNLGVAVAALLLAICLVWNLVSFIGWAGQRQYSLITADRDLNTILSKDAVITGSYATALTQENKRGCIIHMFGVVNVDKEFFAKYPITHIAMDDGNSKFAKEQYPELMNQAKFVTRYYLRGIPVMVYRIAEVSPNPEARKYLPTDYEVAQNFIAEANSDSAQYYMRRYLDLGAPNFSANMYVGDALNSAKIYDRAIESYRRAQDFSPGDAVSALGLGNAFTSLGAETQNAAYFDSALVYFKVARHLYRSDPRLENTIQQLERRKQ